MVELTRVRTGVKVSYVHGHQSRCKPTVTCCKSNTRRSFDLLLCCDDDAIELRYEAYLVYNFKKRSPSSQHLCSICECRDEMVGNVTKRDVTDNNLGNSFRIFVRRWYEDR